MGVTKLGNQLFVNRSQYIRIENPLHKHSENAYMCFDVRTRDFTVNKKGGFRKQQNETKWINLV